MKRSFYYIMMLVAIAVMFNSCLNGNDDYIYYDDAAIVSFSLSAANVYTNTTSSDGTTTTTKEELDNGTYKFHIDQLRHEIYNTDSLPMGTDAKHIIVYVAAKSGGSIYVKSMTSDSLKGQPDHRLYPQAGRQSDELERPDNRRARKRIYRRHEDGGAQRPHVHLRKRRRSN